MTTGIELIAAERQRQIEQEGWTAEHDEEHVNFELTRAAVFYACYAIPEDKGSFITQYKPPLRWWPWEWSWFKPKDNIRNLVRAGALIAAEIDRLQREGIRPTACNCETYSDIPENHLLDCPYRVAAAV